MKIILISSGVLSVFPSGYGGLENVVGDLAVCLSKKGHEVFVVAPSDSNIEKYGNIKLIDGGPCASQGYNAHEWESRAWDKYQPMMHSDEFKGAIWHDHSWAKAAYLAKMQNNGLTVVSTLHGMLPYHAPPPVKNPCFIGISKHHADSISAGLGIPVRYVYNGIDLDKYTEVGRVPGDRYLFLARITAFKGAHTFIDTLNQLNEKGDLVGDDILVEDPNYVERVLLACNDTGGRIRYWGGVPRDMAIEFFRKARAYMLPGNPGWQEPFGLTVIESMACGCPVVATASGAVPELIEHGKTGLVVKSLQELPAALASGELDKMTAKDCRTHAEKFSRENMANGYVKLYEDALAGGW